MQYYGRKKHSKASRFLRWTYHIAIAFALAYVAPQHDAWSSPLSFFETQGARLDSRTRAERTIAANPLLSRHSQILMRFHTLIEGLKHKAAQKGTKLRIRLGGGTVYNAVAAKQRGISSLKFDDIDFSLTGLSKRDVLDVVDDVFPELRDHHIEHKGSFLPGVPMEQLTVDASLSVGLESQFDIVIMPEENFDMPMGSTTVAAQKVNLPAHRSAIDVIDDLTDEPRARALMQERAHPFSDERVFYDPGNGLKDTLSKEMKVTPAIAKDKNRFLEGMMQALYLSGKDGFADWDFSPIDDFYRDTTAEQIRAFFNPGDEDVAQRRLNYIMSIFRARDGRSARRVAELAADLGLLQALLPGMDDVIADPQRWNRTLEAIDRADMIATTTYRDHPTLDVITRQFIFSALLSELGDNASILAALQFLPLASDAEQQRVSEYSSKDLLRYVNDYFSEAQSVPSFDQSNRQLAREQATDWFSNMFPWLGDLVFPQPTAQN